MPTRKIVVATNDEMEQSIFKFVQLGFTVANKTQTSALLVKKKEFSVAAAVLGLLVCLVGLLVYAIIFACQKDEYIEITLEARSSVVTQPPIPQPAENRPRPPSYKPKKMIHCNCNHCSGEMQFNEDGFNPRKPPVVPCPHCGLETELYIPHSRIG
jgi:hypothetical protein